MGLFVICNLSVGSNKISHHIFSVNKSPLQIHRTTVPFPAVANPDGKGCLTALKLRKKNIRNFNVKSYSVSMYCLFYYPLVLSFFFIIENIFL